MTTVVGSEATALALVPSDEERLLREMVLNYVAVHSLGVPRSY